jgi:hypothetical protein
VKHEDNPTPTEVLDVSRADETALKVRLWEQHGQTILLGLISASMAFVGNSLWESNKVQATLVAEVKHLSERVAKLEGATGAMQQLYVTRPEWAVHEQRIQALEAKR